MNIIVKTMHMDELKKMASAMTYQHRSLASGRWGKLSFFEQMAHIGSEIERAINWKAKNKREYSQQAGERALELIDLTLDMVKVKTHLKEIARMRETVVDYFFGNNEYGSTDQLWRNYFPPFMYAARKDR